MYKVRLWSVSQAKYFDRVYQVLERLLDMLHPLWLKIGYSRIEPPITFIEKHVKGFLFDCQMCGQCVLHDTGMSCPMNCPKQLRNGPCGGVGRDGSCEVKPEMRCVWVEAWRGNQLLDKGRNILAVQFPMDHRLKGSSSWLSEVRKKRDAAFYAQGEGHDS